MAEYELARAETARDVAAVKMLFQEYADWLNVDLCFQGFDREMAEFPSGYDLLLLGKVGQAPAAAVGLKALDGPDCEMKRLYCRPEFQGMGLGRALAEAIVKEARDAGYRVMKLDTLSRLEPAIALYRSMGFVETGAYYDNPLENVIYMEKAL